MLRNCFLKLLMFTSLIGLGNPAHAFLFMATGADSLGFQKYALQSNQQTYTQWLQGKTTRNAFEAHTQILEFSQRALKDGATKQVLLDWNLLRLNIDLNPADREVLILLAEKLRQQKELCRYALLDADLLGLLENPNSTQSCPQKATPIPSSLKTQLGAKDLLVIDGKIFTYEHIPPKLMPGSYQWKIISDQYKDRDFQGSAYEFTKLRFSSENWVSGDCQNYKLNHQDFAVSVQAKIYFTDACVTPGLPPEKTFRDWAREHKTLLWGVGIVAAGLAAAQLKDKTLVFTKP